MFKQSTNSRARQIALAAGVAVLAATSLGATADAKHFKHKHFKKFGVRIYVGGPGFYVGHHGWRRCRWLRRKAMRTGSHYWWHRYRMCRRHFY